ncbi:cactus-binding carboxy-terminal, cactin [Actinidia rufa]|uniref:Splicing factor Cactin n=1 Tax=Actinidia rufa TaxID=165716 RepID=A0A7J0E0K4_9ERIC|nr:cactus-binding carboxy-terminal, cactin [Actinidia rufa]
MDSHGSPPATRSEKCRRRSRDLEDGSDDERKRKPSSSKKITEQDMTEYMNKRAQKKALKVAKKLKSQTVSGCINDSNPFGDSNLNENIKRGDWRGILRHHYDVRQREFMKYQGVECLSSFIGSIEQNGKRLAYLPQALLMVLMVCDWELAEAQKRDALDRARVRGEQPPAELLAEERGLHSSVEADVRNLLQGKSYSELEVLQSQIESQMRSSTAKEVEYWEVVLKRLHIYKAKACLREIHTKMLRKHLERLEQPLVGEDNLEPEQSLSPQEEEDNTHDENDAQAFSPEPILDEEIQEAAEEAGSYSPQRIQEAMASRPAPQDNFEMKAAIKAMGAMEEGDAVFGSGDEVNLDSQVYWWHDKYRPRKPKYFNRVHAGYEWNKYNQTHYDHDNPPPKIVQGYKFNIFYPGLVDKIKAPTYTIEKRRR